ncbi:MAG: hypothetical protein KAZ42_02700 [Proteocatella sp.]|nr:hypothetical protein [Proteocatella sp.]NCB71424.1 hypothetical protein [Clostridia bacterium]MBP7907960.1 hypothetical protein [Proteocatella sp.]MBP7913432.1 hypothetical protein [Proteocatella sp.]MBP8654796.1 hypothetical protein [Proteocatella sp.]
MKNTDEIKHEPDIKSMSAEELEKLSSALLKKQEELSKKENELNEKEAEYVNHKENFYDKINIDIKTLDKIIVLLILLFAAVILFGIFRAQN